MIQSTAIHSKNVTIKEEKIKSLHSKFVAMLCPSRNLLKLLTHFSVDPTCLTTCVIATRPKISSQVAVLFVQRKIRCNDVFFLLSDKIYTVQRNNLMTPVPMTRRMTYTALHTSLYVMFRKHSCVCFICLFSYFIIGNTKIALPTSRFHLQAQSSWHTLCPNRASSMKCYSVCCVPTPRELTRVSTPYCVQQWRHWLFISRKDSEGCDCGPLRHCFLMLIELLIGPNT